MARSFTSNSWRTRSRRLPASNPAEVQGSIATRTEKKSRSSTDAELKRTRSMKYRLFGKSGLRDSVVLATKYSNAAPGNDPNAAGNHRKSMMQAVEASLKRLRTDYIDLYWVHIWDAITPVEEVMRGLDDLVRQGKVLYVGISDAPAWWVAQANTLAELRGWTQFMGLQIEYSLIERTV